MKILVDPKYNPNKGKISSATKLAPGISCAKFLGSRGGRTTFERLYNESFTKSVDRRQVARNLVLHAQAMTTVLTNPEFAQHRLVVSDGLYEPFRKIESSVNPVGIANGVQYTGERPSGFNEERRFGRGIGYQLIDKYGKSDLRKTFDLAVFWKDYISYNDLELAYDSWDPSGEIVASILLTMPEMPASFEVEFNESISTSFNGEKTNSNELLEILPDDEV